jgi:hypothetical protein
MKLKPLTFVLIAALFTSLLFPSCDKDDENEQSNPPGVPTVNDPLHVYGDYFYVNWSGVVGATGYYADVATDQNFTNILPGYENMEVEKNGMFIVEDVNPGNSYFVRMRAYNANGTSKSSSYKEFQTRTANVLPNMDMESWLSFPNYESPEPVGVWTSANKVADLNPDLYNAVLFKTDDKVSGNYAAKMITDSMPGMPLITASLSTGIFKVDLNNPLESMISGVPYKSRPTRFQGWYKYMPVDGDSCEIRTTLSRWNPETRKRDKIGEAIMRTTDHVEEYTFFDLEVVYLKPENPDTIDVVFAASAGGEYFIGGIGSTLFIDDFTLLFGR